MQVDASWLQTFDQLVVLKEQANTHSIASNQEPRPKPTAHHWLPSQVTAPALQSSQQRGIRPTAELVLGTFLKYIGKKQLSS